MAAPPVTLPAALNTWARGSALAAWDIKHVHDSRLRLDPRGLAPLRPLHLARYNRVELVVPTAFLLDGFDFGGRTVDLHQGNHCVCVLLLEVDLLRITPIDAVCIRLDLVLEHGLSHVVERVDSDVGGGVVLTHMDLRCPIVKRSSSMGRLHLRVYPSSDSVARCPPSSGSTPLT